MWINMGFGEVYFKFSKLEIGKLCPGGKIGPVICLWGEKSFIGIQPLPFV